MPGIGYLAYATDTEGNTFGVIEPGLGRGLAIPAGHLTGRWLAHSLSLSRLMARARSSRSSSQEADHDIASGAL